VTCNDCGGEGKVDVMGCGHRNSNCPCTPTGKETCENCKGYGVYCDECREPAEVANLGALELCDPCMDVVTAAA
jgi:hypothetical protein